MRFAFALLLIALSPIGHTRPLEAGPAAPVATSEEHASPTGAAPALAPGSLYADLGGQEGITRMVEAIIVEVKADKRIAYLFEDTDWDYLRDRLVEQICELSGGGCEYTGLPMPDAHSGMAITRAEFNWFVEDTERGMRKAGVPLAAQNRLLALLAKLHGDIVGQ